MDTTLWRRMVFVCGVLTELIGINAIEKPAFQVIIFPGNPGNANFFKPFMEELYTRLNGVVDVLAITHAGHDTETKINRRLWNLQEQIDHKMAFMQEHILLPGKPPVVLIGHSIGATMAIKVVNALEGGPHGCDKRSNIIKVIAIFPFFENNYNNKAQQQLRYLVPWYKPLSFFATIITCLPMPLRQALVRLNKTFDPHAVELTATLLSHKTVCQALYLACDEFKNLSQQWDWTLLAKLSTRLHVMGCENDMWMNRGQFDTMCQHVPNISTTWYSNLSHAFCTSAKQSAIIANHVLVSMNEREIIINDAPQS